ncbi:MAG: c-type cytochrome domain-containing protein [Rhodanobacter sp.]
MSSKKIVYTISLVAFLMTACSQREVSYHRDIDPIFQTNCAICHTPGGAGYAQSGFSVGTYQDVMKGTKYGRVVSPGNSVSSTLVRLVKHQADATINMPKNYMIDLTQHDNIVMPGVNARRLPERDIELITKWVDQGAKDN